MDGTQANRGFVFALGLAMALSVGPALAQDNSEILEALDAQLPGDLINDPTDIDWGGYGSNYRKNFIFDEAIPGGGAAVQFRVNRQGTNPYDVSANVPLTAAIEQGEIVTVGFWARTEDARTDDGLGVLGVRIQQDGDPWPGFGDTQLSIGPEWEWHEVSAQASVAIRNGQGIVVFQLAGARQTIQIGQTIVVKGASRIA